MSPENRARYRAQVQVSYGIYLDAHVNPPTSPWYIDPKGGTRVERLRANTSDALRLADGYVWMYGEQSRWWPTTNAGIKTTWEEALPGATGALAFAVDPDAAGRRALAAALAAGTARDLVLNGDFSADKVTDPTGAVLTYKDGGLPAGWHQWEATNTGSFTWDRTVGKGAPGAARGSGIGNGCFIQSVSPVKPGERYAVSANVRPLGGSSAWIRVRWQTEKGAWTAEQHDRLIYGKPGAGGWGELFGLATVPEDAGRLVILLGVGGQTADTDVAWFDDVHCYKVE